MGGERILVVDEDDGSRGLLKELLESGGYIVWATNLPDEASRRLREGERVDALLFSAYKGGIELAKELAEDERLAGIPRMLVTGWSEKYLSRRVPGLGIAVNKILLEPFGMKDLLEGVRDLLQMGKTSD